MFIVLCFWFGAERLLSSNFTLLTNGDFDLLRLGLFSLRQHNLQDAILISGFHFVAVDAGRQRDATLEATEETFVSVPFLTLLLLLLPLSRNGQNAVMERQVDVLLLKAGQLGDHSKLVFVLVYIQSRSPSAERAGRAKDWGERAIEQAIQFVAKRAETVESLRKV